MRPLTAYAPPVGRVWLPFPQAAADRAPPSLVPYLRKAAPFLAVLAVGVNKVAPVFISIYSTAFTYFNMLPYELMMVVFGLALCFFGGVYPAAIAAAEVGGLVGGCPGCGTTWQCRAP